MVNIREQYKYTKKIVVNDTLVDGSNEQSIPLARGTITFETL